MNLYNDIINKKEKISVVGLGYVGMPIAVAFSEKINVIGFDINKENRSDQRCQNNKQKPRHLKFRHSRIIDNIDQNNDTHQNKDSVDKIFIRFQIICCANYKPNLHQDQQKDDTCTAEYNTEQAFFRFFRYLCYLCFLHVHSPLMQKKHY